MCVLLVYIKMPPIDLESQKPNKVEFVIKELVKVINSLLPMILLSNREISLNVLIIMMMPILVQMLDFLPDIYKWLVSWRTVYEKEPEKKNRLTIKKYVKSHDGQRITGTNHVYEMCCDVFARKYMHLFKDVVNKDGSRVAKIALQEYDEWHTEPEYELDFFKGRAVEIELTPGKPTKFVVSHEQVDDNVQQNNGDNGKKEKAVITRKLQEIIIETEKTTDLDALLKHCEEEYVRIHYTKNTQPFSLTECIVSRVADDDHAMVRNRMTINVNKRFNNIYLSLKNEDALIKNIRFFMSDEGKAEYARLGLPRKMGLLLYGSPGGGKTSVIYAIANETKKHIVNIDLSCIKTNDDLRDACKNLRNSIIKFDDIDSHVIVRDRKLRLREQKMEKKRVNERMKKIKEMWSKDNKKMLDYVSTPTKKEKKPSFDESDDEKTEKDEDNLEPQVKDQLHEYKKLQKECQLLDKGLTLDCVLDILDGYKYFDECIVIMTSNHPEMIDPAVKRPGRIDYEIHFELCNRYQFRKMMQYICGFALPDTFEFPDNTYTTSCLLNTMIIPNRHQPEEILKLVESEKDRYQESIRKEKEMDAYDAQMDEESEEDMSVWGYGSYGAYGPKSKYASAW